MAERPLIPYSEEALIEEVRKIPILWNHSLPNYGSTNKAPIWTKLSRIFSEQSANGHFCKNEWARLKKNRQKRLREAASRRVSGAPGSEFPIHNHRADNMSFIDIAEETGSNFRESNIVRRQTKRKLPATLPSHSLTLAEGGTTAVHQGPSCCEMVAAAAERRDEEAGLRDHPGQQHVPASPHHRSVLSPSLFRGRAPEARGLFVMSPHSPRFQALHAAAAGNDDEDGNARPPSASRRSNVTVRARRAVLPDNHHEPAEEQPDVEQPVRSVRSSSRERRAPHRYSPPAGGEPQDVESDSTASNASSASRRQGGARRKRSRLAGGSKRSERVTSALQPISEEVTEEVADVTVPDLRSPLRGPRVDREPGGPAVDPPAAGQGVGPNFSFSHSTSEGPQTPQRTPRREGASALRTPHFLRSWERPFPQAGGRVPNRGVSHQRGSPLNHGGGVGEQRGGQHNRGSPPNRRGVRRGGARGQRGGQHNHGAQRDQERQERQLGWEDRRAARREIIRLQVEADAQGRQAEELEDQPRYAGEEPEHAILREFLIQRRHAEREPRMDGWHHFGMYVASRLRDDYPPYISGQITHKISDIFIDASEYLANENNDMGE